MKKIFFLLFIFLLSCTTKSKYYEIENFGDFKIVRTYDCEVNKFFKIDSNYYLVNIVYDKNVGIDHLTGDPTHYDAYYTLYQVHKSKYGYFYLPVGKTYKWEFANFRCYEDEPRQILKSAKETMLSQALKDYYQQKEIDRINANL